MSPRATVPLTSDISAAVRSTFGWWSSGPGPLVPERRGSPQALSWLDQLNIGEEAA